MRRWILVTFIANLFISVFAYAEQAEKLIILRSQDDWGPNEYIDSEGKLVGSHIDLIQLAAEKVGVEVEFVAMPWKRALKSIREGTGDAISYVIKTPERSSFLIYHSGNIISQGSSRFAYLNGRDFGYDGSLSSVRDRHIGVIHGYNYGEKFDRNQLNNLTNVSSEKQLLQMLLDRRLDLILVNIDRLKYKFGTTPGFDQIRTMDIASVSHDIYLAFSRVKGKQEIARKFADVMPDIRASKKYQEMLKRYQ